MLTPVSGGVRSEEESFVVASVPASPGWPLPPPLLPQPMPKATRVRTTVPIRPFRISHLRCVAYHVDPTAASRQASRHSCVHEVTAGRTNESISGLPPRRIPPRPHQHWPDLPTKGSWPRTSGLHRRVGQGHYPSGGDVCYRI